MEIAVEYAARQHGVVGRRQLVRSGIPSSTIARRIRTGYLFPVYPGVYAVGRHRLSWHGILSASLLAAGDGAVLGFRTAATVWGFMDFRRTVEMLRPKEAKGGRAREQMEEDGRRVSIHIRRTSRLPDSDIAVRNGFVVTTVSRTLLDLAAVLHSRQFERVFLEADRLGLITDRELLDLVPRSHGRKGGRAFRERADARLPDVHRARSVLEAIFLRLARDSGLPMPEVNRTVSGYEVDFLWREARVIVELDGYEFHRGREAWERDVERTNHLAVDGWDVRRFTWGMVNDQPEWVAKSVQQALATGSTHERER